MRFPSLLLLEIFPARIDASHSVVQLCQEEFHVPMPKFPKPLNIDTSYEHFFAELNKIGDRFKQHAIIIACRMYGNEPEHLAEFVSQKMDGAQKFVQQVSKWKLDQNYSELFDCADERIRTYLRSYFRPSLPSLGDKFDRGFCADKDFHTLFEGGVFPSIIFRRLYRESQGEKWNMLIKQARLACKKEADPAQPRYRIHFLVGLLQVFDKVNDEQFEKLVDGFPKSALIGGDKEKIENLIEVFSHPSDLFVNEIIWVLKIISATAWVPNVEFKVQTMQKLESWKKGLVDKATDPSAELEVIWSAVKEKADFSRTTPG
jgi:hypothetical protein